MTEQNKSRGKRRRGHGEGSIYHRDDGRWVASISLGGLKRKIFYAKTRREAQELLHAALQDQKQGLLIAGPQQPLKQYLTHWLEEVHKASIRPRSYERYESMIRLHLIPPLGHIMLQKLSPQQVRHLLSQKLTEGLSPTTVINLLHLLHKALDDAVRWGLLGRNVCNMVSAPRKIRYEIQPLTPEQVRVLLAAVKGHRLEALFILALATGMRKGELLGLKWQDLNEAESTLQVRRILSRIPSSMGKGLVEAEPKTKKSRRNIVLPPFVLEALQQQRLQQEETRANAGANWHDRDLMFCSSSGLPLNPNYVLKALKLVLKEAGLPDIRFHDLRHSAATLLLSLGVHPKVVQELLGHSQISMTLDIYSHVLPTMQKEAMERLTRALKEHQDNPDEPTPGEE